MSGRRQSLGLGKGLALTWAELVFGEKRDRGWLHLDDFQIILSGAVGDAVLAAQVGLVLDAGLEKAATACARSAAVGANNI